MIWKKDVECMQPAELKKPQSDYLKKLIPYIYNNCPVYKKKLDEAGVKPDSIKSIDDIKRLPLTTKIDMRDNYPYGMFSTRDNLAEIHISSGTTGNPTLVGYTRADVALWSDVMARAICCAGGEPGDTIQIAYGYGLFTGGLGFHYGALEMGMKIIPTSSGQTARQLKIMQDFKPRVIACTPSYVLYMAEEAKAMGIDPATGNWKIGIFGAEPWSESMRKEIEQIWNMAATDVYGLSEIIGPGVAQECTYKDGLHIFSDVFYPEIIDPQTDKEVEPGQSGELVITTLTKQAIPLIRYRTRDIVSIRYDKCRCGRTSPRISKIKGRTDDMLIINGINVFPSQIEEVVMRIPEVATNYVIQVEKKGALDHLTVKVEIYPKLFLGDPAQLESLKGRIIEELRSSIVIHPSVELHEPNSLPISEGKAKRVIDLRPKE